MFHVERCVAALPAGAHGRVVGFRKLDTSQCRLRRGRPHAAPALSHGATMPMSSLSGSATADLGLGDMLQQQVAGESDEERRKRLREMQMQKMAGPGATPATAMLFGAAGGAGGYGA